MKKYSYDKLIVLEGVDGAGKSTQVNLLEQYLKQKGKKVIKIHSPNYAYYTGLLVQDMLQGYMGMNPYELNLYAVSSMYSIDRWCDVNQVYRSVFFGDDSYIILLDRYTQSNMIHQGSKLVKKWEHDYKGESEYVEILEEMLRGYGTWLIDYEYNMLELPRPDKILYLSIPEGESYRRLVNRGARDLYESEDFIHHSIISGDFFSEYYKWDVIDCYDRENNVSKSVEDIHKIILDRLKGMI